MQCPFPCSSQWQTPVFRVVMSLVLYDEFWLFLSNYDKYVPWFPCLPSTQGWPWDPAVVNNAYVPICLRGWFLRKLFLFGQKTEVKCDPSASPFFPLWSWTWCMESQQLFCDHKATSMQKRWTEPQRCWPWLHHMPAVPHLWMSCYVRNTNPYLFKPFKSGFLLRNTFLTKNYFHKLNYPNCSS